MLPRRVGGLLVGYVFRWTLASCLAFSSITFAAATSCPRQIASAKKSLADFQTFVLMAYNVLNLDEHVGSYKPDLIEPGALRRLKGSQKKSQHHVEWQARIIKETVGVHIGAFPEVEGLRALRYFNQGFLDGQYDPYLERGNDERGIQVGFLVHRSLPFEVEVRSNKHLRWDDPILGPDQPLFSRDLPVLIFRTIGNPKPLLIVLGKHYKSKRTRSDDDPESRIKRRGEVEGTGRVVRALAKEFGINAPIAILGDDNGVWTEEPEYVSLRKALQELDPDAGEMTDAFDVMGLKKSERITHTYHPRGGPTSQGQLDSIILSPSLVDCLKNAYVYRYKHRDGNVMPIARNIAMRKAQPSDHLPAVAELLRACLEDLRSYSGPALKKGWWKPR